MAISLERFIGRYPEFSDAPPDTIEAALAESDRATSDSWLGGRRDDAVMLRTAHVASMSPWGRDARLMNKDGSTIYGRLLEELIVANCVGKFRLA